VEAAYEVGHAYRCLQDVEALSHAGQADGKLLTYAAAMHMYLGHYSAAATTLEQALARDDEWIRAARGACWLRLGNLYDLLGQRERAVEGYQHALTEPDAWYGALNSTHALARHHLQRPFTESEILAELRPRTNRARGWRLRRR
jgi:tetratricopeptide (TPR) repeat protein